MFWTPLLSASIYSVLPYICLSANMVLYLYCICYTFVQDKCDDTFVSHLSSLVSRQMLHQICLIFVFWPNTVLSMISTSVPLTDCFAWLLIGR